MTAALCSCIYYFESKGILHHRAPHPTQQSALGTPLWHPGPPTTPLYMPHLRQGGKGEGPGRKGERETREV